MRRRSSPLDFRRHVGQPHVEEPDPPPADAVEYFWRLAEADDLHAVVELWRDFPRWSADLQASDLGETADHLVSAVEESKLWNTLPDKRREVLRAIRAAAR
jgi:hypothetical protein